MKGETSPPIRVPKQIAATPAKVHRLNSGTGKGRRKRVDHHYLSLGEFFGLGRGGGKKIGRGQNLPDRGGGGGGKSREAYCGQKSGSKSVQQKT